MSFHSRQRLGHRAFNLFLRKRSLAQNTPPVVNFPLMMSGDLNATANFFYTTENPPVAVWTDGTANFIGAPASVRLIGSNGALYLALASDQYIYSSPDGVVWSRIVASLGQLLNGALDPYFMGAYGAGVFCVCGTLNPGEEGIYTSTDDGVTWNKRLIGTYRALNYFGGKFWANIWGDPVNNISESVDGVAWSTPVRSFLGLPNANKIGRAVLDVGAQIICVGTSDAFFGTKTLAWASSDGGATFASSLLRPAIAIGLWKAASSPTAFLTLQVGSNSVLWRTVDGTAWTSPVIGAAPAGFVSDILYKAGVFVLIYTTGYWQTSIDDGVTWSLHGPNAGINVIMVRG